MNLNELVEKLFIVSKTLDEASKCWQASDYEGYKTILDSVHNESARLLSEADVIVNSVGVYNLGRCYNAYVFKIITKEEPPSNLVKALRSIGIAGGGQSCKISKVIKNEDGTFEFSVTDLVDSSD